MIDWKHNWQPFAIPEKEDYFLRELARELRGNTLHPLFGKELRVTGWIPGYDDFILHLPREERYAYVHLTWRQEDTPDFHYPKFLDTLDETNAFVSQWENA